MVLICSMVVLLKLTDRVCDKPYSDEFKQTTEYKAMECK